MEEQAPQQEREPKILYCTFAENMKEGKPVDCFNISTSIVDTIVLAISRNGTFFLREVNGKKFLLETRNGWISTLINIPEIHIGIVDPKDLKWNLQRDCQKGWLMTYVFSQYEELTLIDHITIPNVLEFLSQECYGITIVPCAEFDKALEPLSKKSKKTK